MPQKTFNLYRATKEILKGNFWECFVWSFGEYTAWPTSGPFGMGLIHSSRCNAAKWYIYLNILRKNIWGGKSHCQEELNTHVRCIKKKELIWLYTLSWYMTHNSNLNLKFKFYRCVVHPTVIISTLSVYIRFTLKK